MLYPLHACELGYLSVCLITKIKLIARQTKLSPGHENSICPINVTTDFGCRTSENSKNCYAFLFLSYQMICKTSRDFDNVHTQEPFINKGMHALHC